MVSDFDELDRILNSFKTDSTSFFTDKNITDSKISKKNNKQKYLQQGCRDNSNLMTFTKFILDTDNDNS